MAEPVRLKELLQDRHWQTYRTFCIQYNKAAQAIDKSLMDSYPSRAQLHRWLHGELKGLPYSHHCQVLEAMFPGIQASQMFEPTMSSNGFSNGPSSEVALAGHVVNLELNCVINIDCNGLSVIDYQFKLLNLTDRPIRRIAREQWFESTAGRLAISPHSSSDRKVHIQRVHDTANMSKFSCVFDPAIMPGETGIVAYSVTGGQFLHDHYWQQSASRFTKRLTLTIRHEAVDILDNCSAVVDYSDGSQESALDDLVCSVEDRIAVMTLTRNDMKPSETATLRWVVSREDA